MTPAVWDDAAPRITAAAAAAGLHVEWPNEDPGERPRDAAGLPLPWLDIEVAADASSPVEIGGSIWVETGSIFLHVMIPTGSGIRPGLVARKTLSDAFRPGNTQDAVVGLIYRDGQAFDPMGPGTDDGVYRRLTLIVRYHYQDIMS